MAGVSEILTNTHTHTQMDFDDSRVEARKVPRVLLVGPALSGGGAENRFHLATQHLFGGNTSLAVFKCDGQDFLSEGQVSLDLGWRGTLSHPFIAGRLRRHLRRHDFDAVMAFGFYPCLDAWAAVQGLARRPALILTEINSPRRESLEMRGSLRRPIVDGLRRFIYPRADFYAANSEDGVNDAVRFYGVDPKRVRRIPNLVDRERLERLAADGDSEASTDSRLSICIVTRLIRRKRVDTLLRAAAGLPDQRSWRVDIVGEGEERAALQALAQSLNLAERVIFHGWLQNPYPIVSRAAVSVLCSEFEGFSNSVLEAMALGTPVVTSLCTTDARDMCEQGAALGFPVGDHRSLRAHLLRLLEDEALRAAEFETKAWTYARRHTIPVAIKEYETLILDAIERRRGGG